MRLSLTSLFFLCLVYCTSAAADESKLPSLSQGWKFSPGDDPSWSNPALDDSDWQSIDVGKSWEEQGHADYDGYGWYRKHIHIPADYQHHPDLNKYGFLNLVLGSIDDADQTWWNGQLLGETGQMPHPYKTAWSTQRNYRVPAQRIHWDADNVIAVRVYDGTNQGGMCRGPYALRVASWRDLVTLKIRYQPSSGIFKQRGELPISISIDNEATEQLPGLVHWSVENDEGKQLVQRQSKALVPAEAKYLEIIDFIPTSPGFYRLKFSFQRDDSEELESASKIFGYRPEEVQTKLTRAADFEEFWKKTLAELATVEPNYEMKKTPDLSSTTHEVFEVTMRSLGGVRVAGWYEQPKAGGPHPALLRLPGYSSAMQPTGTQDPWGVFSFNIRGHGNSQLDVSGTPTDYWIRGLDDKRGYFYQGAYADCIRAVDFLASRDEIDVQRIAVTGGSQGGGLSLVTAALDQRISLCAPDIPFLCNWGRYFITSSWPEIEGWIRQEPHRSWEQTLRTLSYFDALNFADKINCPVFLGLGLQDDICPPVTIFAVYNKLSVPKEYRVYPNAGHWVEDSHFEEQRQWILRHFNSTPDE